MGRALESLSVLIGGLVCGAGFGAVALALAKLLS